MIVWSNDLLANILPLELNEIDNIDQLWPFN